MDKKQLDSILEKPYNPTLWRQILTDVFGARNLNQTPQPIMLLSDSKGVAESAFELGFFNTTDDRIIGLYEINLTNKPQIWRNRVALRELLRNIYKYDVDGALVVFVQGDKWRLSFISEIRVLNDDGTIDKRATEPKRYTYLLGKGEKTKTPTDRLSLLTNKKIALVDIRAAFSVEALNNEFYKQISEYFYELVGATTTKGKKTEVREKIMNLPGVAADDRKTYQEFAVRLIGRTVFCWFLREKCSEQGKPLLPEKLLSSDAVQKNKNYYHEILEPLFFQTLNTPMDKRIADLPEGCEKVPFLNGGLFEPQIEDFYNAQSRTGNFQNYALKIPDVWFEQFFTKLEEYNFTIDENSPTEVEISVDPEMLGRIFENLLAEIDPDSGETARKATGSFYTPREIVNYMVDESLLIYLKSKLLEETVGYQSLKSPQATFGGNDWRVGQPHLEYPLVENRWKDKTKELEAALRELFSYSTNDNPFGEDDTKKLIKAIDECKILDPACGSGAFPIGVLQRLVYLLGKLDKKSSKWKAAQLGKIDSLIESAKEIDDGRVRSKVTGDLENRKAEIEKDFASKEPDFPRKLFLIEKCIYGVDIQPIAAEISKLRCFLTLIVDDTIDESAENRGVNPLPNLEFKFVTADALLKLPDAKQINLFNSDTRLSELERIRHEYLNSFGTEKEAAKYEYEVIRKSIKDDHENNEFKDERSVAISKWNPFAHNKVDWFDSEWMFGVKAFDIVIGNPPYGVSIKGEYRKAVENSLGKVPDYEIYYYFIERANLALEKDGILSYIIPNSYLFNTFAENYRKKLLDEWKLLEILDCSSFPIFQSAVVRNTINTWEKGITTKIGYRNTKGIFNFQQLLNKPRTEILKPDLVKFNQNWGLAFYLGKETFEIISRIKSKSKNLDTYFPQISQGLIAYDKYQGQSKEIIESRAYHYTEKVKKSLKPWLWGADINRYEVKWNKKEYIDYCDGIANPREPKYFKGSRILVREITNPSVFAGYTKEELYNDPSILIVLDEPTQSIKSLLGILNSKLATYFHFNHSPKATKGAFPKILVKDIKEFPLPKNYKFIHLENLVDYILFLKEMDAAEQVNEYVPNSHLVEQFEEVIDALVYELYFEEDFQKAEIAFHQYASRDFPSVENLTRAEKIKIIHAAYQTLRQKDGEIRNNLKLMDIRLADLIMPIKTAR